MAYTFFGQRDNAVGQLSTAFNPGDALMRLDPDQGAPFAPVSAGSPIRVTLYTPAAIVNGAVVDPTQACTFKVFGISDDALLSPTLEKGDPTLVFPAGSVVARVITQADFAEIHSAVNDALAAGTIGVTITSPNSTISVGGTAALPTLDVAAWTVTATGTPTAGRMAKFSGSSSIAPATAGTDFLAPTGDGSGLTGITQSQVAGLHPDQSPTFAGATLAGSLAWKNGPGGATVHRVDVDGRTYWGNTDLGGTFNFFAGGSRNLAQFQWQTAIDSYTIVSAIAGNAVTGSLYGFLASGSVTDRFSNRIQNSASAGDAVFDASVLGNGSAFSAYGKNGGQAWSAGYHQADGDSYKISAYGTPAANNALKITPLGATTLCSLAAGAVPLTAQSYSGTTADTLRCEDSTGAANFRVNKNQCPINHVNSAPADGDLNNGDCAEWFDSTSGRVCWKAKTAGGTVVTGYVQLT